MAFTRRTVCHTAKPPDGNAVRADSHCVRRPSYAYLTTNYGIIKVTTVYDIGTFTTLNGA